MASSSRRKLKKNGASSLLWTSSSSATATAWRGNKKQYLVAAVMIMLALWRAGVLLSYLQRKGKEGLPENTVLIVIGVRGDPENLKLRVTTAAAASISKDVILSGGAGATGPSEARAMRDLWPPQQNADDPITFYLEEDSQDTAQNAVYSAPILQSILAKKKKENSKNTNDALSVIVVTNDFHAPRTKLIFEEIFIAHGIIQNKNNDGVRIQINTLAAPTVPKDKRKQLFEKELFFLNAKFLTGLMQNATAQPLRSLSEARIEQARKELRTLQ